MQRQTLHTETTIRAGWPELLPLTALAVCLLFGLFTLATRLPRGPVLCGAGLLCGLLLYLLLYRRNLYLPANTLPFLAASGVGYLCAIALPQLEGLGAAACLLAGLGLPAAALPLLTLSAVGFERIGRKALPAMAGAALVSGAVLLYLLRACADNPAVLMTAVAFLALLLLLCVFSLMPSLAGTATLYLVEQREGSDAKPLVLPQQKSAPDPDPIFEEEDEEEGEDFAPFEPPRLQDVMVERVAELRGEIAPLPEFETSQPIEPEPEEPAPPIFEALLDDFARQQQETLPVEAAIFPLTPADEDALPDGGGLFAAMLREAQQEREEPVGQLAPERPEPIAEPEVGEESVPEEVPDVPAEPSPFYDVLSEKERQLAALILQGHAESSIASTMGITLNTQKSYRKNLYNKLEIHSKRELFGLAARHGFGGET